MQKPVVNVMVKAARAAGNVLLRSMHKLDAINVVEKDRMDFASDIDEQAEKIIIKELRRAYPDYAILGEETGQQGKGHSAFVIDPLDGTSNFLRGSPTGACRSPWSRWRAHHGVIFDPLRNELFTASRGAGAMLNDKKIRVAERKDITGSLLITGFPPRERERAPAQLECIRELLRAEDIRRTGSAALTCPRTCGRAGRLLRGRGEAVGHRRRRAAGARGRWPRLRLPWRRHRAAGREGSPGASWWPPTSSWSTLQKGIV
jgi:myo-inositol-1(or 4)-monophosphatase